MELTGKVAIVTGGAVRVGRSLSLSLAEAGCDVLIHYARSAEPAREVQREAEAHGVRAAVHGADLADPSAPAGVIDRAREALGRADILINSAALFLEGDLAATTLDSWERQHAVNLRAPFLLSQAFAAQVGEAGQGKIINILDARIFRPAPDHFAYRLTKSALHAMTEILAHDLAPAITVNAVALGAILPPPDRDAEYLERLAAEHVPLRRAGDPAVVTRSVLHLLREDFLTGVTLRLDGGQFL